MKKYSNIILSSFIIILILGGLILFFQPKSADNSSNSSDYLVSESSSGVIFIEESAFNFGTISMAKGKVSHTFKIKNTGSEPLIIGRIYTSCMCTEATFIKGDIRKGPVGMQGHDYIPKINESLNVGEEAEILVVFDPAAHGPAGLGKIERAVFLENTGKNQKLEILIKANVAP